MVMADFGIYPQAVRNQMWSVCGGVLWIHQRVTPVQLKAVR
jgi:hypothetical protein